MNDFDRLIDRGSNEYRLCVIGDLNGWIGNRMSAGITGKFGVLGKISNGAESGYICVGNTYLEHKRLHKYKRMARGQNGVKLMRMLDLGAVVL